MIIEVLEDKTMFHKKTGRIRFRNDRKGRVILQVEYKTPDRYGDNFLDWIDANIGDIQWREK